MAFAASMESLGEKVLEPFAKGLQLCAAYSMMRVAAALSASARVGKRSEYTDRSSSQLPSSSSMIPN
jgi:hypothetical protein